MSLSQQFEAQIDSFSTESFGQEYEKVLYGFGEESFSQQFDDITNFAPGASSGPAMDFPAEAAGMSGGPPMDHDVLAISPSDGPILDHFIEAIVVSSIGVGAPFHHQAEQSPPSTMSEQFDHDIETATLVPGEGPVFDHIAFEIPAPFTPLDPNTATPQETKIPVARVHICVGGGSELSPGVCGSENLESLELPS